MKKWRNLLEADVHTSSLPSSFFPSFFPEYFTQKAFRQAIGKKAVSGAADQEVLGISHIQGD